jgi:hypothetical protein
MSADVTEQTILEGLHKDPLEHWGHVLEFLHNLAPKAARVSEGTEPECWTIAEWCALPPAQRDAILEAQAALVEFDYRNDPERVFDSFSVDDVRVDCTKVPAR